MHGARVSITTIGFKLVAKTTTGIAVSNTAFFRKVSLVLLFMASFLSSAAAQSAVTPNSPTRPPLAVDEIVSNLVQNNLQRARALGSYEGTRVYRLEYRGFPSSRTAEMVVNVRYRSPDSKEFTIESEK